MFKKNKKFIKSNKGFTFLEVMVVVVIIAILAGAWFFTGKGHVRIAMANEGRVLVDKIIAQERDYIIRNSEFFVTGSNKIEFSPALKVDARSNKYFKTFKTEGLKVTGSGKILDGVKITVYPKEDDADLAGVSIIGEYWLDGTTSYIENL